MPRVAILDNPFKRRVDHARVSPEPRKRMTCSHCHEKMWIRATNGTVLPFVLWRCAACDYVPSEDTYLEFREPQYLGSSNIDFCCAICFDRVPFGNACGVVPLLGDVCADCLSDAVR